MTHIPLLPKIAGGNYISRFSYLVSVWNRKFRFVICDKKVQGIVYVLTSQFVLFPTGNRPLLIASQETEPKTMGGWLNKFRKF